MLGLSPAQWPPFFDGRDLSPYWSSGSEAAARARLHPAPETIQIEYWGMTGIEATGLNLPLMDTRNTYKTVRIVGEDYGYLYSHWCTNETEVYDTVVRLSPAL